MVQRHAGTLSHANPGVLGHRTRIELECYVPPGHALDSSHTEGVPVELCDGADRDVADHPPQVSSSRAAVLRNEISGQTFECQAP